MLKQKKPTPQEIWKARRDREQSEKDAFLPPGLINHGNTCFMNSVLQGLIATRELYDLVHFSPLPHSFQAASSRPIFSARSPQLTNGHGLGGESEHEWVPGMPLGDVFIKVLCNAWSVQDERKRNSLSPKEILSVLGRKYDQYEDFRQQDAHEFLRLLLDAMRMEEFDIIKKRQPPPPKEKKKRLKSSRPTPPTSAGLMPQIDEADKLESFVDMLFGGKLASFLVCETCKHVSHTYEDFNDLSLSIKPEDFVKERRKNKLKSLAKKFGLRQDSQPPRSSSVPPSPTRNSMDAVVDENPEPGDPRRRSHEILPSDLKNVVAIADPEINAEEVDDKEPEKPPHVGLLEPEKIKREHDKDDDNWARLGRRITKSVKKRKGRSLERTRDKDINKSRTSQDGTSSPARFSDGSDFVEISRPFSPLISPDPAMLSDVSGSRPASARLASPSPRRESSRKRTKSPPRPKLSREETAYLRHILADVGPTHHFGLFQPKTAPASSSTPSTGHSLWTKLSQLPGIEECLRWFTSVEMLDGENMVGCRRCWKIANGKYKPRPVFEDPSDSEDSEEARSPPPVNTPSPLPSPDVNGRLPPDFTSLHSSPDLDRNPSPASTSAISINGNTSLLSLEKASSEVSLPTTIASESIRHRKAPPMALDESKLSSPTAVSPDQTSGTYIGLPIPLISTTGPESPMSQPSTAQTVVPHSMYSLASASLSAPRFKRRRPLRKGNPESDIWSETSTDSFDETESEASCSDASSVRSPFVSPNVSNERLNLSPAVQTGAPSKPRHKSQPKVPRSQQIVMRRAYKRYLISEPPPVLVIHLKRFQQTIKHPMMSFSSGFKKIDDYVAFPEYLDLTPFLVPKKEDFGLKKSKKSEAKIKKTHTVYRLFAVVIHIGSMLGGHYVAYTALANGDVNSASTTPASEFPPPQASETSIPTKGNVPARQWAHISDTVVRLTTLEEVLKSKAYICMYERIS